MMQLSKPKSTLLFKILAVALALLTWEITALVLADELILVSPVRVLVRLVTIWGEDGILFSVLMSFLRIVGGFSLLFLWALCSPCSRGTSPWWKRCCSPT